MKGLAVVLIVFFTALGVATAVVHTAKFIGFVYACK